jgi:hypothetical protein
VIPSAFSQGIPHEGHARPEDVEALIERARTHPLGLPFLERGALESVAAIFGVHAFVVDSARDRLRG